MTVSVTPSSPETGLPITIRIEGDLRSLARKIVLSGNGKTIEVPVRELTPKEGIAQFALYEAGEYEVRAGTVVTPLRVGLRRDVDFFTEFSLLGTAVGLILGGMILWARKSTKRSAGGSI